MKRYSPTKLAKEKREVSIDDLPVVEDLDIEDAKRLEAVQGESFGESLPTISVGMRNETDVVYVRFDAEPKRDKSGNFYKNKRAKEVAYTEVTLLKARMGWDNENKKDVQCKRGDKVTIDLKRHSILWKYAQHYLPLTGKSFAIANVGTVKTQNGDAVDYRWKALES